ncbi:MAG: helix-turn-helix domain-containing protein, partial [Cellulosilyticaceae bacterium]
ALHEGEKRLCAYILEVAQEDVLEDRLTNVASALGISYRHLLRMLKGLCEASLLRKEKEGYRIIDRKGLAARGFVEV